jgi:ABC-type branched-subunit amino acid transport system ATPase component
MALFEVKGLTKSFGGLRAINGVDLEVNEGEIVSVIGPNGAGKTTFFNVVTGLYQPDSGQILFEGQDLVGMSPNQITDAGVARTFQTVRLFQNMSILENVMVGHHSRSKGGVLSAIFNSRSNRDEEARVRARAEEHLSFFGSRLVGYRLDQLATSLSYANRRRLEIARAMATEAKLLCLDEPTAGMNPKETAELAQLITQLRDQLGYTIVFIEHDMRVVKGASDRVVVLDHGEKIAEGKYEEVANNPVVLEAYLGRTHEDAKSQEQAA